MIAQQTNAADFLLEGKSPNRTALQLFNAQHTYGDLRISAHSIEQYCLSLRFRKGDRVVLLAENSFFWAAAYLGILRAGLVCIPLPVNLPAADLHYVIKTTQPKLAAVQASSVPKYRIHFSGIHLLDDRDVQCLPEVLKPTEATQEILPDDLAAIMFTSGSTGKPRGVMVSHRNIIANTESIIQSLELCSTDRMMTVLPFHYCFGTSLLHTHLRVGATMVLDSRFMYPETILQRMIDLKCTAFAGVPSHFQILLRNSSLRKKRFPHLRYVQQAGGRLAPAFIRELQEALPETRLFVMYGQTEGTARLSFLPPDVLDVKCGSIGKGLPGVRLRVLNDDGVDVRPSEIGEIVAEGENVALGYWDDASETAATFRGGKLQTGDLATVDDDGFIYIVDRAKDFLKCCGKRISCQQIEDQLLECDWLIEASVVGIPDEVLGEAVKVFATPCFPDREGLEETLREFCRAKMPPQLQPREIVVVKSLPKNAAGKVLKRSLRLQS